MNNLAVVIRIAIGFDMLFQLKNLNPIIPFHVDTGHYPSMQGVGIVLGIVAANTRTPHTSQKRLRGVRATGAAPGAVSPEIPLALSCRLRDRSALRRPGFDEGTSVRIGKHGILVC